MDFNEYFLGVEPEYSLNAVENDVTEEDTHDWYDATELDSNDEADVSNGPFCFETDHAALKGNSDYENLIKSLTILEVQRIKTVKDIEKLETILQGIKYNAKEYLNKIINGDTSDFPTNVCVEKVPVIDWKKYKTKDYSADSPFKTTQQATPEPEQIAVGKKVVSNSYEKNRNTMKVRGRVFDKTKPQTFNQLWTAEEQLRLEELLLDYPAEANENSRWRKIAVALGNRTTKQVCSRVQKYFKKLNKAGLPIPGHQLKTNNMLSRKKKPRRAKKVKPKRSTFFPAEHLGGHKHLDSCNEDEDVSSTPVLTPELKADIIKKVIEYRRKDAQLSPFTHPGIKCAICEEMPLCGTRWSCLVCQTVSLCSDCVINELSAHPPVHPPTHPLEPLTNPSVAHWDPDYTPQSFQSNNYLDPNFVTPNTI